MCAVLLCTSVVSENVALLSESDVGLQVAARGRGNITSCSIKTAELVADVSLFGKFQIVLSFCISASNYDPGLIYSDV